MAAVNIQQNEPTVPAKETNTNGEMAKENPLDNLMERLRAKANHYKTWGDLTKALRVSLVDKRHLLDSTERTQLQKCLDVIQKSIKVTSLQSMVERLEIITRQQGLKFTAGPSGMDCFISSDMFYVEVLLEPTGEVKDVKIAHHGDPVSCSELTKVLSGDFTEFTSHLEGLAEIYQLNADKKQKTKAFLALQALETDLGMLAQFQSSINDPNNVVHKSPVGILQPRKGGHPMKLTFFISPYNLLDVEAKSSIPLTVDAVIERQLGHSVTVCIESSTAHKLQTTSLIIVKTQDGKNLPTFGAHSNLNSTTLPANFVLRLQQPIPMATSLVRNIKGVTNIEFADLSNTQPLISLITKQISQGKLQCENNQGLYVTLPDQHHCYYFSGSSEIQGVMVSAIPFTHPTSVPQILVFLRQQTLFNTLIGSCVRPSSKQDVESALKFEVAALSTSHIIVSFEHLEESLATVDLDLKDITNVKCKIYTLSSDTPICTDEYASKVMQRCLSIPVTMRAIIRKAQGQQQLQQAGEGDVYYTSVSGSSFSYLSQLPSYGNGLGGGNSFGGGDFGSVSSRMGTKNCDKTDPVDGTANSQNYSVPHTGTGYSPDYPSSGSVQTQQQDMYGLGSERSSSNSNMLLENILSPPSSSPSHSFQQSGKPAANTMLMSMLSDVPSANPITAFPFLPQNKPRKQKKRKGTTECRSPGSSTGRSPKRRATTDDMSTPDAESSDSTSMEVGSAFSDQAQAGRVAMQFDAECVKSEPTGNMENFLGDGSFLRQGSSTGTSAPMEHATGEEQTTSIGLDSFSQSKQQYHFNTDPLGFNASIIGNPDSRYQHPNVVDNAAFDIEINSSLMTSKQTATLERQCRKAKRVKSESDSKHSASSESSEEDDNDKSETWEPKGGDKVAFQNTLNQFGNVVDSVKTSPSRSSPTVMKTSIKIPKLGDSLKMPKIDSKFKQKEGRRSGGDMLYSQSRKKDGRKERKRRRAEGGKGGEEKLQIKPIHINLSQDASLMPPPSLVDSKVAVASPTVRPITLNVKPVVPMSSGSKSSLSLNKKGNSPTFKSSTKSGIIEKTGKNSQLTTKYSDIEGRISPSGTKMTLQTSVKVPKHKSGNPKGMSSSGGNLTVSSTSPTKPQGTKPTTLKLKNLNLPASTTITPVNPRTSPSLSSPPISSASISIIPAPNIQTSGKSASPTSNSNNSNNNNNNNGNKSANKPRKSSLDAVIDKLRVQQSTQPGVVPSPSDSCGKPEFRESKVDRKEVQGRELRDRELNPSKNMEGKSKFSSSDQFTIKQSSGIKLTVTKTRFSDNTMKSSGKVKVHQSSEKLAGNPSLNKTTNMTGSNLKALSLSKKASNPGSLSPTISSSPTSIKTSSTGQKVSSPSRGNPVSVSGSAKNPTGSSKAAFKSPSSSQTKIPKMDRPEKPKSAPATPETKAAPTIEGKQEKVSGLVVANLMPPPQVKSGVEQVRTSGGNTPKRSEETPVRQSPRRTPTHESTNEECDMEKAFRQLSDPLKVVDAHGATDLSIQALRTFDSPPWNMENIRVSDIVDMKRETIDKNQWLSGDNARYVEPPQASVHLDENAEVVEQCEPSYPFSGEERIIPNTTKVDSVCLKTEVTVIPVVPSSEDSARLPSFPKPTAPQKSNVREDEDSSPEDGLVIDYPLAPRLQKSPERNKSAWCGSRTFASGHSNVVVQDKTELPPVQEPPTKSPFQISPQIKSPTPVGTPPSNHSLSSSMSRPSPCIIDDDLMDEAVMGLGD